jgi:hypothetical protein
MDYLRELMGPVIASTGVKMSRSATRQAVVFVSPGPSFLMPTPHAVCATSGNLLQVWLSIKRLACSSLVTSFARQAVTIPGSLYPGFQINLHPAMLYLSVRGTLRSEPRGKKHSINAGLAYPTANIPPRKTAAHHCNDVSDLRRMKMNTY